MGKPCHGSVVVVVDVDVDVVDVDVVDVVEVDVVRGSVVVGTELLVVVVLASVPGDTICVEHAVTAAHNAATDTNRRCGTGRDPTHRR